MGSKLQLVGQRFTRLTVVSEAHKIGNHWAWNCLCDCGNTVVVIGSSLRYGTTQSCGCLHKDAITTHGMFDTKEYKNWTGLKGR